MILENRDKYYERKLIMDISNIIFGILIFVGLSLLFYMDQKWNKF
jgi:hypothetical protein